MKSYFNTTQETAEQVVIFSEKNEKQDDKVLAIAKRLKEFGASNIYKQYSDASTPLTSIRRSINTLLKTGFLQKVEIDKGVFKKQEGLFGASETIFKVVEL